MSTWLITGCSTGLGRALAEAVIAAGDNGSSNYTSEIDLYAPNGRAIARSVSADGSFIGKVIPLTGQYRIRVRDVHNNGMASVTLTAFYTGAGSITDSDDAGTLSVVASPPVA